MDFFQRDLFDSQVKTQIKSLSEEIKGLEEEIRPKLAKIEENKARIEHLEKYLQVSEPLQPAKDEKQRMIRRTPIPTKHPQRLSDLAIKVLREIGHPVHYSTLMEKIENEENFEIPGSDPKANFTAHLANTTEIIRIEGKRGFYGLKEWQNKGSGFQFEKIDPEPS